MTTAAKFPTAVVTLADLFGEMPNFPELVLSGAHNASTTSIVVTTAIPAGWPQVGWITIDTELMRVTSWAASTFTVAARDGSAANSQSTTAATHASGQKVGMYLTMVTVNQIEAEIIALETALGLGHYPGDSVGRFVWDWNGRTANANTTTGTGAVTTAAAGNAYQKFATGATSGSTVNSESLLNVAVPALGVNKARLIKLVVRYDSIDANTVSNVYITDENTSGAPSATARHIGLRQAGATINFSTADNTTEQTTAISGSFTATVAAAVDITFDGTTARCYVNGTLVATHATNVPGASAVAPNLIVYITNSAAADKSMYLSMARVVAAP